MAYVNVLEWKAEQVADWLRGLDDVVYPYAHFFLNNDLTGQGLLNLTIDDLYKLHVEKLGHQEIILESLDYLRNFHYNLDRENLQYVCLRLSCKARSLYNEMVMYPPKVGEKQVVTAPVMSNVAEVLDAVRILLSWLDRKPFDSQPEYHQTRATMIRLSLELATNAQRDTFAEAPMDVICACCDKLAQLADQVIQECHDPLILQPASLDVATVRKKQEEELGIVIEGGPAYHHVTEVRMLNPAARIEPGDEIVQVNYQTVVGWQTKKVLQLMGENPVELILTLKKRPKHSTFGQIYMKPFRIPARKKSAYYINNLPSPRTELLVVPDISLPILKRRTPSVSSGDLPLSDGASTDSEDDEAFLRETDGAASPTQSIRSVLSRPRSAPQRRATISGASPTHFRPYINVSEIWAELLDSPSTDCNSASLRSRDSGVSTMSTGTRGEAEEQPERREKAAAPPPRPVTVMGSFPPKPTDLSPKHPVPKLTDLKMATKDSTPVKITKPRMPDPPPDSPPDHAPTSPYMNVPSRPPEYVNVGPDYVNIAKDQFKQPLPKPRTTLPTLPSPRPAASTVSSAQSRPPSKAISHQPRPPVKSVCSPLPRGALSSIASADSGTFQEEPESAEGSLTKGGKGKRPVPLPRKLSAQSPSSSPQRPSAARLTSPLASPRDVPTPTANFKSYRRAPAEVRRRASCAEEGSGRKGSPAQGGVARISSHLSSGVSSVRTRISKSMSMTKLSGVEQRPPLPVPVTVADSEALDSPLDSNVPEYCEIGEDDDDDNEEPSTVIQPASSHAARRLSLTNPLASPYYVSDVYREGSPEKNWIDSLRSADSSSLTPVKPAAKPAKATRRPSDLSDQVPTRMQDSSFGDTRSASHDSWSGSNISHKSGLPDLPSRAEQERYRLLTAPNFQPVSHFPQPTSSVSAQNFSQPSSGASSVHSSLENTHPPFFQQETYSLSPSKKH